MLAAGLAVACRHADRTQVRWLLFLAFSGIAADFDFLPGLLVGDINRWHHQGSHSLLAAMCWGLLTCAFVALLGYRQRRLVIATGLSTLAYASHLLLDCLTTDTREPRGIPLFWPFSDAPWLAPVTPIPGVSHGVPGDSLGTVLLAVFSKGNLLGALIECLVVAPILVLLWIICRAAKY